MSNKKIKKCLTIQTTYDIIITQGNTNTKGSEQMNEEKEKALARLAETVSQNQRMILFQQSPYGMR